jgi:hypothetical protein
LADGAVFGRLARLLVAAVAAPGCASFSAPIDRTLTRGEVTARVEKASARHGNEVRLAVAVERLPPGLKLLRASVGDASGSYCGGVQALMLARSAAPTLGEPLASGERIVLEFPETALPALAGMGPRLDLLVESSKGTRRCLPFELTSSEGRLSWSYDQRFTLGLDIALERYTEQLGAVVSTAFFVPTLGMWVDRFRFEVGAGVGGAACPESRCEVVDSESDTDESTVFPLQAGVQTPIWEYSAFGVGVGARYRAVKLAADTRQGRETYWAHGPVLAPYFAIVPAESPGPNLGGSRLGLLGFEVPLGYVMADGEHTFSFGVNMRSFFTSF